MTSGIGQGLQNPQVTTTAHSFSRTATRAAPESTGGTQTSIGRDIAEISQDSYDRLTIAQMPKDNAIVTGKSTAGKMAGAANSVLSKYMNSGDTSLSAINMSRKSLGDRIDKLIKKAGVKLGKDETLAISVDKEGKIRVGGLKDSSKIEAIEEALNDDKRLAATMKSHVAIGKVQEYAEKQQRYLAQGGDPETVDDLFTNRSIRAHVINEYLQNEAGVSLSDMQLDRDSEGNISLVGVNDSLRALFSEDEELATTISNILENNETPATFEVSLEFANGTISDSTTEKAARSKVEAIKLRMMGGVDPDTGEQFTGIIDMVREEIENQGVDADDPEYKQLMSMLSRGFAIDVGRNGEYEIAGADEMSGKMQDILKEVVRKSLASYAESQGDINAPAEPKTTDFVDVVDTFIEQHRFEHGDVDEHEHKVRINFGSLGEDLITVVSPEADKKQDESNQALADEMGGQLRGLLEKAGVDVSAGLELEVDDSGKITVIGDPGDSTIKAAQQVIDQFVSGAKSSGFVRAEEQEELEAGRERREVRGEMTNDYEQYFRDKIDSQTPLAQRQSPEYIEMRDEAAKMVLGWDRVLPRNETGTHNGSVRGKVSTISEPTFSAAASDNSDGSFKGQATSLFRQLINGMGQFHDDRKGVSYRFSI